MFCNTRKVICYCYDAFCFVANDNPTEHTGTSEKVGNYFKER